jgi:hypothetical protein
VFWLIVSIGTVAYLAYASFAPTGRLHRQSVEETMREVGGLASIPQSAQNVRVESRWFAVTASFSAPPEDIQRWINGSPNLQGITGERIDDGTRVRYGQLTGNQSVQVTVDESTNHVDVVVHSDPL